MKGNINTKTENATDKGRFDAYVNVPPINMIYAEDCRTTMKRLADKSIKLIIADPPYYKIKGEFDWEWKTFDEYLSFMEEIAVEFKRILADNGSLFVYGHAKRVAYIQVIYDKYFTLENNITWNVMDMVAENQKHNDNLRSFPPITERILFYSQEEYNLTVCIDTARQYLRDEITKARGGISLKEINTALQTATNGGGVASAILSLDKAQPGMITEENYKKLKEWLGKNYLRKEYEELRKEYETSRRPFNNIKQLTDNWFYRRNRVGNFDIGHETIKPLDMSKMIVATTTKEQDLVYVPFVGSGTECVAANELNRRYIGSEKNYKYVEIAKARIKASRPNGDLFYDTVAL